MIKINRPVLHDAPLFCEYFFSLTKEVDLLDSLEYSKNMTIELIKKIPSSKEGYSYQSGKWTTKMVLTHIIDCERYYCYYAMCRSRKMSIEIWNFNQDIAALNSNTLQRTIKEIEEEYLFVREATIKLFNYMVDEMLDYKDANDKITYTPRSLGWMISGHNIHHCNILNEKYLNI